MITQKLFVLICLISFFLFVSCDQNLAPEPPDKQTEEPIADNDLQDGQDMIPPSQDQERKFYPPLDNTESRVTKKPFGILINPDSSPVQPERFQGYHTGTDFEVTLEELNQEITVFAICSGEVKTKKIASGYGGIIVQSCQINSEEIQVLYGHLNITTHPDIQPGGYLTGGQEIALLAEHESELAAGERKHLHLGIYNGSALDLRGYFNTEAELDKWIDPESILFVN